MHHNHHAGPHNFDHDHDDDLAYEGGDDRGAKDPPSQPAAFQSQYKEGEVG